MLCTECTLPDVGLTDRDEALQCFQNLLGEVPGIAVIHSSLPAIMGSHAKDHWDLLHAFRILVSKGWTLAFPSFTFSFCRGADVDLVSGSSETGVLADLVLRNFPFSARSPHPIYSFVAVGPKSAEILACDHGTAFGGQSQFAYFDRFNAKIVMLGCGWNYCTQFHFYEELASVPYRIHKVFSGRMRASLQSPLITVSTDMFVRDLKIGAVNDFSPLEQAVRTAPGYSSVAFWHGTASCVDAQTIGALAKRMLAEDALAFVAKKAAVKLSLDHRAEAKLQAPFKVAVLGHANVDLLAEQIQELLQRFIPGREHVVYTPGFGAISMELSDPNSGLAQFAPDLCVLASRVEDLAGTDLVAASDIEKLTEAVESYASMLANYSSRSAASFAFCTFANSGIQIAVDSDLVSQFLTQANQTVSRALAAARGTVVIDVASEAARGKKIYDERLWHVGRISFSSEMQQAIAARVVSIAVSMLSKGARLLVLDLDNTLWGGVLGEDGLEGIKVGGDFPGNTFSNFQRKIKALASKGIALAICSKNDEDLAMRVLREHPAMILRDSDFVAHRINWLPKWQNIKEIAEELNLGLGSILFIDDNPVERESVKTNLPAVQVLELPADPAEYGQMLHDCPWINILKVQREDLQRNASYKARSQVIALQKAAANIDDFLHDLGMSVSVQRISAGNISRAAQLCQKTNQFNTTTRRYSAADLETLVRNGSDVAVIGMGDKFTAEENVGLVILNPRDGTGGAGEVDLLLMSCRVMGRKLEFAMLDWAKRRAWRRGWKMLSGSIVETPRNTPVRELYADAGFEKAADGKSWDIQTQMDSAYQTFFRIRDEFEPV